MKCFCLFFLIVCGAMAAPTVLAPELSLGGPGRKPLQFRRPGAMAASAGFLYIADQGNGRIQKISTRGEFRSQTDDGGGRWHEIAALSADLAGMIYAAGIRDSGIAQFDAELLPVAQHALPGGILCYEKGGNFLVWSLSQARAFRWKVHARQMEPVSISWANGKPVLHCVLWENRFWILTDRELLAGDLFGRVHHNQDLPRPVRRGFLCTAEDRLLLVLDRALYSFRDNAMVVLGALPESVLPGGAIAESGNLWITDQAGNRILRFAIPKEATP